MNTPEIYLPRKLANQLLHLAQSSPDTEVCGLLGGRNGVATRCYPIENVAKQPEQQFLLNASQQILALAQMREYGEELFAIYHSHPTASAVPSAMDIEFASYPDALTLIISLNTKGILEMRCFKINEQVVQELTLMLCED